MCRPGLRAQDAREAPGGRKGANAKGARSDKCASGRDIQTSRRPTRVMREQAKEQFARKLRSRMTDAEQRLWFQLRLRRLAGYRFRRQHPLGQYIADFACLEAGLIIEVDGGQHLESAGDKRRDAWFSTQGFRVLRFWDDDVLLRIDEVTAAILEVLAPGGPHPPSAPLAHPALASPARPRKRGRKKSENGVPSSGGRTRN